MKDQAAIPALHLYLAVALGSMLGGTSRWGISTLLYLWAESPFPWGTVFVNASGSFLIGFYAELFGPKGRLLAGTRQRHFVMTGFCGGYTTFSIFSLETLHLAVGGETALAGAYLGLSLLTWFAGVWAGFALAAHINRSEHGGSGELS